MVWTCAKCKKIVLLILGLCFFIYFLMEGFNIFGNLYLHSIQLRILSGLIFFLIFLICLDLKEVPFFENRIKNLKKVDVTGIFFSSVINVLIGFVVIVVAIFSILYGSFLVVGEAEAEKLLAQSWIWFALALYFIVVISVLFAWPLYKHLIFLDNG